MELILLIISTGVSIFLTYISAKGTGSHKSLMNQYRRNKDLYNLHFRLTLLMIIFLFLVLCAINNTYWHLSYIF